YSRRCPAVAARQLPVHPVVDFAADQPPVAIVRPCASSSVHVPVTPPVFRCSITVHVPPTGRPSLLRAAHELTRCRPSTLGVCWSAGAPCRAAVRIRKTVSPVICAFRNAIPIRLPDRQRRQHTRNHTSSAPVSRHRCREAYAR